jgi:CheY-like chemotaxis protein
VAVAEVTAGWRERQHALRQPLNALGLYAAALQARPLPADQQPLVRGIVDSLAALEALLDQWGAELAAQESARGGAEASTGPAALGAPQAASRLPGHPTAPAAPAAEAAILVIDDDPASRMSMSLLLEAWGARVVEFDGVATLGAALAAERGPAPRLAIVDYHLGAGGGTGPQALQQLRAAWPGQRIPALLISGDEAAARAVADHDGPLQVLRKPVEPSGLLRAVEDLTGPPP